MSSEPASDPAVSAHPTARAPDSAAPALESDAIAASTPNNPSPPPGGWTRRWLALVGVVALAALACGVLLWQKVAGMEEQLARQSGEALVQAGEARASARQAQDLAIDTAAKLSVTEARLAEVTLQRTQLEDLMQSLSRTRDQNLVDDIESALRLAQQQAQLTGSVAPLLAALGSAQARVARAAQPRLSRVARALEHDVARIRGTTLADTPALLVKLDELVALADEIPLANAVPVGAASAKRADPRRAASEVPADGWWPQFWSQVGNELRALVRVSRVPSPEAVLLSPEQSFFVRENLKLKLLNARLGLLSRQIDALQSDLAGASATIAHYFDTGAHRTQSASALLQQVQAQARALDIPRIDETLTALATAGAGH